MRKNISSDILRELPMTVDPRKPARDHMFFAWFIAAAVAVWCLSRYCFTAPVWSEERGWVEIGEAMARGERSAIITPKSDYPSSFQVVPIALLIARGVDSRVASRTVALAYALVMSFFLVRIARHISGPDEILGVVVTVTAVTSYWTLLPCSLGWHEISHVGAIGSALTYFLLRLMDNSTALTRHAIALGALLGLSFWTLYTPALMGGAILMSLVLALVQGKVSRKHALVATLCMMITMIPFVRALSSHGGSWFDRHHSWFVLGGDWPNQQYRPEFTLGEAVWRGIQEVARQSAPFGASREGGVPQAVGIFPEYPLVFAAIVGLVWGIPRKRFLVLILPAIVSVVGLLLSNASLSPWRMNILGIHLLLIATVGYAALSRRFSSWRVYGLCALTLVLVQGVMFAWQAEQGALLFSKVFGG